MTNPTPIGWDYLIPGIQRVVLYGDVAAGFGSRQREQRDSKCRWVGPCSLMNWSLGDGLGERADEVRHPMVSASDASSSDAKWWLRMLSSSSSELVRPDPSDGRHLVFTKPREVTDANLRRAVRHEHEILYVSIRLNGALWRARGAPGGVVEVSAPAALRGLGSPDSQA